MSYKEIIDNVSNIEDLDNTTILKVLEKFSKTIKDFAIEQSGLNNLVNVEFIPSDNNTTYTGDSVDYLGTLKLTLSDNIIVNKPCNIKFNIKGSNTIVVDVDEFNNSLELHLDNSVVTTLNFAESERQKSETNGATVHEKQIADVEHIETIYEMNTKNTIGGTAYTAGIPFSNISISNVDFNKYKYLRFTCRWNDHANNWFGGTITFDLDLKTPYNSDLNYISVISNRPSNCYATDSVLTFDLVGFVQVGIDKNNLIVNGYKITYTGERTSYTPDNYLTYFRIEKIEGVF